MRIVVDACPDDLRPALAHLAPFLGQRRGRARRVVLAHDPAVRGFRIAGNTITYARRIDACRALGSLLADSPDTRQHPRLDMLGVMLDVSRNAVPRPDMLKDFLARFALCGIDTMLLYMEDTYEVPGEPLFGYLRGAYSHDELKDLDDFAHALGIELVPCIQTLAHLEQVLQWPEYESLQDVRGVLLADHEPTYLFIEKMIAAASAPFRTRRIHVGMDEAQGLGTGRYLQIHGQGDPFDIFNRHLARVRDICRRLGLAPMIWSDMYFRLGSRSGDYYDPDTVIPQRVADAMPHDVQLVYWDYYHTEASFYEAWIRRHKSLGSVPVVAGGIWTWSRFWAALPFSIDATDALIAACRAEGVREVFVTLWGDDGMECDLRSALPGVCLFAEHGWSHTAAHAPARFRAIGDASFEDYVRASDVNTVPGAERTSTNVGKTLLWQDPLIPLIAPSLGELDLSAWYGELAADLSIAAKRSPGNRALDFPRQVARVLTLKAGLHAVLFAAYRERDREILQDLLDHDLRQLRREVERLWKMHRNLWLETHKPFGLEVIEQRYGGLLIRLDSLRHRIERLLAGKSADIPELDARYAPVLPTSPNRVVGVPHGRMKTPSAIK